MTGKGPGAYCPVCDTYWGDHKSDCPDRPKSKQELVRDAYPKLVKELKLLADFVVLMGHEGEQREARELLKTLGEE